MSNAAPHDVPSPLVLHEPLIANSYATVVAEGKHPAATTWQKGPHTLERIRADLLAHPAAINVGLITGHVVGIDIDATDPVIVEKIKQLAFAILGATDFIRYGAKGAMLVYQNKSPIKKITVKANNKPVVEFLGVGQQFIGYGLHPSGVSYRWENEGLFDPISVPLDCLPEVTPAQLEELAHALVTSLTKLIGGKVAVSGHIGKTQEPISAPTGEPISVELLTAMLAPLDPGAGYEAWRDIVAAIGAAPGLDEDARRDVARKWSRGDYWKGGTPANYQDDDAVDKVFDSMPEKDGGIRFGTLVKLAREGGYEGPNAIRSPATTFSSMGAAEPKQPVNDSKPEKSAPAPEPEAAPIAPRGSEIDLADGFASAAKDTHRYVAEEKAWYSFDGKSWRKDTTKAVRDEVRRGIADYAKKENDWKAGQKMASNRFISGVEQIAQADRRLAATVDQWDSDPTLLCTPAGIVDLTTGNIRPAKPEDYCRKITAVAPAPVGAPFPNFKRVLSHITDGDAELEAYLQKAVGYCAWGEQVEKQFFIVVGEHNSGKTTLFETVREIMGDYATSATAETFLEDPRNMARATNDLAELIGYRLVVASEPDKNRSLSASRLKRMVGNDSDRVRRLYQSGTVQPTSWKPVLHCNDVPHLGHGDDAVKSRLRIIPGGKTIPQHERDTALPRKLKAEYPAILRWMIEGCVRWQKEGLGEPAAVTTRGEVYFKSEDPLANWLAECGRFDGAAWHTTDELYRSYSSFAGGAGAVVLNKDGFAKRLSDVRWETKDKAGNTVAEQVKRERRNRGQGFVGVGLKPTAALPSDTSDADIAEILS